MSNNDHELIWEAYERSHELNHEPDGFARIQSEWENDILPKLEANKVDDLDYTTKPDGSLVIFFPDIRLSFEQNINLDMVSSDQMEQLKREFDATFGKYNFISFEVEHAVDHAVEDAKLSHEGQWLGIGVHINAIEVSEEHVEEYFRLLMAINTKAKELSRG